MYYNILYIFYENSSECQNSWKCLNYDIVILGDYVRESYEIGLIKVEFHGAMRGNKPGSEAQGWTALVHFSFFFSSSFRITKSFFFILYSKLP